MRFEGIGKMTVDVEFARMSGSLCRYSTDGNHVTMIMADYLEDAPPDVIEDYLRYVFSKRSGPPRRFIEHISSEGFISSQRPRFLARSRRFTLSTEGEHRSLADSLERLIEMGMLSREDSEGVYLTWSRHPSVSVLGTCHSMFRVISVSNALDTDALPEDCLDFVLYHEFLHARQGARIGMRKHDAEFRREERAFPGYERIKADLARLRN
ncbi:MAG: M48 family metallopeptidase [Candidatus Methanomethylophilaceae archaeon]|nr:M48 family metallopeptidase [Candidatus Methanomethylophilaceae archaeon]